MSAPRISEISEDDLWARVWANGMAAAFPEMPAIASADMTDDQRTLAALGGWQWCAKHMRWWKEEMRRCPQCRLTELLNDARWRSNER